MSNAENSYISAAGTREVPKGTPMFDGPMFQQGPGGAPSQAGNMSRQWILFLEAWPTLGGATPIVGFVMNTGATGTNVGPMLPAPFDGTANVVVVVIKASDPSVPLTFDIIQQTVAQQTATPVQPGISIFSAPLTIPANTASGTLLTFVSLDEDPLTVEYNDIFTINISSGSTSWMFTAVVETSTDNSAE